MSKRGGIFISWENKSSLNLEPEKGVLRLGICGICGICLRTSSSGECLLKKYVKTFFFLLT